MRLLGLVLLPLVLMANTEPQGSYEKWLVDAERALDSPEYCQRLSELVKAPERDFEVSDVLQEILQEKCNGFDSNKTSQ